MHSFPSIYEFISNSILLYKYIVEIDFGMFEHCLAALVKMSLFILYPMPNSKIN